MGTPEFAVASLAKLNQSRHEIVAVITASDKIAGRGMSLNQSAVKKYALEQGLPLLQPEKLRDEGFLSELKALNADLFVVVAFRMLPELVWSMPPKGTINLHASLLPDYRGAAPINWAIINGEKESGLTTFFIEKEIDTGAVLEQHKMSIGKDENVGSLYERMMHEGADLLLKTVNDIADGSIEPQAQIVSDIEKNAPKLTKENTQIDWSRSAKEVYNLVRGLNPYPTAWCKLNGNDYKVFETEITDEKSTGKIGGVISDAKSYVYVQCGKGKIALKEIQAAGKKRMKIEDFLRGNQI